MKLFKPTKYYQNILSINYDALKKEGIKYLIFDLDNTLLNIEEGHILKNYQDKIKVLSKTFTIFIITNAPKKKLKKHLLNEIYDYYSFAIKPFKTGFNRLKKKYHLLNEECIMIGDQLLTDILLANRCKIKSILVDPISNKDLKITSLNRKIEQFLIKKYQILERGKYNE
ncbi:MAG: YqeG family HAD IIIA-type phosphatase [Bacilli bacterium]